jgi:hypothetical protein
MHTAVFVRSSFCGPTGCVEVAAQDTGTIALRDSKDLAKPAHLFTAGEWDAFIAGVKAGEFDRGVMIARLEVEPR